MLNHFCYHRMVRRHKRGDKLRHTKPAVPLICSQQLDLFFQKEKPLFLPVQFHHNHAQKLFRQREQVLRLQLNPHRRNLHRFSRRNLLDKILIFPGEIRFKPDPHVQIRQDLLRLVPDNQIPYHGYIILLHGKINGPCKISVHAYSVFHAPPP